MPHVLSMVPDYWPVLLFAALTVGGMLAGFIVAIFYNPEGKDPS